MGSSMVIAYVSDERYVALADVSLEFLSEENPDCSYETRSRASGSVHLNLPAGRYRVVLSRAGFGSKSVSLEHATGNAPYQFRMLSDGLLGYAWPKWLRSGERSEFRVHSVEPYKLGLWRLGTTPEFIRNLGWFDEHGPRATMQITPDGDYTQGGVLWNTFGYTSPHHKQFATAPERSGLYYFQAETARGMRFAFPWIVAPARPTAPVAVLASNITWNAYNNFGGRSNYINPDRLPSTPTINARQDLKRYTDPDNRVYDTEDYASLSFDRPEPINHIEMTDRPTDPIEGRAACHLAAAEWRLLAWMEREGFAYDYYAETQLHAGQLDLDAYKVLILSTHPEYWSRAMYRRVKRWVFGRGGRLVYLGGNGINCEVVVSDDLSSMSVKNGDAREIQKRGLESRFHLGGESESSLLGIAYDERGIMTGAPYRVIDAKHWAFEGTGLQEGDVFGTQSLHMRCPGGASGHETDKITVSSPSNLHRVARGMNIDDGGADLVTFETDSGGAVFSVGSIAWPSALLVDPPVSRITANVLNRFLKT